MTARGRKKEAQVQLIVDPSERIWQIVEAIRASGALSVDDVCFLEETLKATPHIDESDVGYLCAVFRGEWEKAHDQRCPRLTKNEGAVLTELAKKVGGTGRLVKLIAAFFLYREKLIEAKLSPPPPDAFGLQKKIEAVAAFAAKLERKAAKPALTVCAPPKDVAGPKPEQVKAFVRQLAAGKARSDSAMSEQQESRRSDLLQAQVDYLRGRQ